MGTSSSHSGRKDRVGLLPDDYNEQYFIPEVSWKTTKTGFSKYINNNGGSIKKTSRNYIKSSGGVEKLIKSSKSGIKGAIKIAKLLSNIKEYGYKKTFEELGIEYKGRSIREICSCLVNYFVEGSESKEDSIARMAAVDAMSKVYKYMEDHDLGLDALEKVDDEITEYVLCTYVECYIYGRILNDLQFCLEKYSDDIERTIKVEQEMKEYVSSKVSTSFQIKEVREMIFGHQSIDVGIEVLYRNCYSVLEEI